MNGCNWYLVGVEVSIPLRRTHATFFMYINCTSSSIVPITSKYLYVAYRRYIESIKYCEHCEHCKLPKMFIS